jgi:hypothetical protein
VVRVVPQPKPPEVPVPPPPFTALFSFAEGGAFTETDTVLHPAGSVPIFDEQEEFAASDGLGSWARTGRNRFTGRFVKIAFSPETGEQTGYIITRTRIELTGPSSIEFRSESDFVLGPDPDGEPFFRGGVALAEGSRLPAR